MVENNGFISRNGLDKYIEKHENINDYSFVKELTNSINEVGTRRNNYDTDLKNALIELNSFSNNMEDIYLVERIIYEETEKKFRKEMNEKIGSLEKMFKQSDSTLKSLKKQLITEKKFVKEYAVLDRSLFNESVRYETKRQKVSSAFSSDCDSFEKINLRLPMFSLYELDNPISQMLLECRFSNLNGNEHFPDLIDIKDNNLVVPFEGRKFNGHEKLDYYTGVNVKSEFYGKISHLKKKIEKAKKTFGKNIYVVSKAHWRDNEENGFIGREMDDFMIVGHIKNTDKFYLIAENKK
ncbi:hypothetical protein GW932_02255 [archaeon]|nr:hypothetical protein [archaeon]